MKNKKLIFILIGVIAIIIVGNMIYNKIYNSPAAFIGGGYESYIDAFDDFNNNNYDDKTVVGYIDLNNMAIAIFQCDEDNVIAVIYQTDKRTHKRYYLNTTLRTAYADIDSQIAWYHEDDIKVAYGFSNAFFDNEQYYGIPVQYCAYEINIEGITYPLYFYYVQFA